MLKAMSYFDNQEPHIARDLIELGAEMEHPVKELEKKLAHQDELVAKERPY